MKKKVKTKIDSGKTVRQTAHACRSVYSKLFSLNEGQPSRYLQRRDEKKNGQLDVSAMCSSP